MLQHNVSDDGICVQSDEKHELLLLLLLFLLGGKNKKEKNISFDFVVSSYYFF